MTLDKLMQGRYNAAVKCAKGRFFNKHYMQRGLKINYIKITKENIDKEHICCAMSGKQSVAKKRMDEANVRKRTCVLSRRRTREVLY